MPGAASGFGGLAPWKASQAVSPSAVERGGHPIEIVVEEVAVRVECHRGARVAEYALHCFDVRAGADGERCRGVPQIVGSDARQLGVDLLGTAHSAGKPAVLRVGQTEWLGSIAEDIVVLAAGKMKNVIAVSTPSRVSFPITF